jgi:hypothetical protein
MPRETQKEINSMFQYVFDKAAESGRNDVLRTKEAIRTTKIADALREQLNKYVNDKDDRIKIIKLITKDKFDEAQKEIDKYKNKPIANQNYDDKYRPIVDTFIMNLSREEKFEVLKALHNQDTKKLEALIKKYTSKPITLKKIPKVPKVSSKKILKGVPEFDHNIPDYEFNIPTKMTKLKPSVSSKQQSKVIKEIDNMLKDINKIIDDHKPVTIKAEIKTVKKRGRPPKTTTVIDVNTKTKSKPKPRGRPRLSEEEKKARREVRKEATRLRNIEKKENMKRIKAEAKAKLEEHKLAIEEEKKRLSRADMRRSKEIDELRSDFTMFRRYVKYLPTPDEVEHLEGKKLQSAIDYLADAEMYYSNAVDTYKRYKKEGLINKSDLDKLLELFEVKQHLDIMNNVKNALNN